MRGGGRARTFVGWILQRHTLQLNADEHGVALIVERRPRRVSSSRQAASRTFGTKGLRVALRLPHTGQAGGGLSQEQKARSTFPTAHGRIAPIDLSQRVQTYLFDRNVLIRGRW